MSYMISTPFFTKIWNIHLNWKWENLKDFKFSLGRGRHGCSKFVCVCVCLCTSYWWTCVGIICYQSEDSLVKRELGDTTYWRPNRCVKKGKCVAKVWAAVQHTHKNRKQPYGIWVVLCELATARAARATFETGAQLTVTIMNWRCKNIGKKRRLNVCARTFCSMTVTLFSLWASHFTSP